jgi:hypothetical protein
MAELGASDQAFVKKFEEALAKSDEKQTNACLEQWQRLNREEKQTVVEQMNKDKVTSVLTNDGKELIVGNPYTPLNPVKVFQQKEHGWKRGDFFAETAARSNADLARQANENLQRDIRNKISPETAETMRKVTGAIQKAFQQAPEKPKN